jgi:hypothetical protein
MIYKLSFKIIVNFFKILIFIFYIVLIFFIISTFLDWLANPFLEGVRRMKYSLPKELNMPLERLNAWVMTGFIIFFIYEIRYVIRINFKIDNVKVVKDVILYYFYMINWCVWSYWLVLFIDFFFKFFIFEYVISSEQFLLLVPKNFYYFWTLSHFLIDSNLLLLLDTLFMILVNVNSVHIYLNSSNKTVAYFARKTLIKFVSFLFLYALINVCLGILMHGPNIHYDVRFKNFK